MDYKHTVGGAIGRGLMPTGKPIDQMKLGDKEIDFTICDAAHIIAFARARDFGLQGDEHPKTINQDKGLLARVREFRGKAAYSVGMCRDPSTVDEETPILPMVALLSETPDADAHVQSRLFLDNACHSAMADAGATCTAACSRMKGSLVSQIMRSGSAKSGVFNVHHPSGILPITIQTGENGEDGLLTFSTLSFVRTARFLFEGELFITEDLDLEWSHPARASNGIAN